MGGSLLIPTNKDSIRAFDCPLVFEYVDEMFFSETVGISKARNELSRRATQDRFIFADDDIIIKREGWEFIQALPVDMVAMLEGRNHPISRLMVVPRSIFNQMGGFDERIKHNAEDLDFYWSCLENGVGVQVIPGGFVDHKAHKERDRLLNYFESAYVRVKHKKVRLGFFVRKNPIDAVMRLAGVIYYSASLNKGKQ